MALRNPRLAGAGPPGGTSARASSARCPAVPVSACLISAAPDVLCVSAPGQSTPGQAAGPPVPVVPPVPLVPAGPGA